MSDAAKKSPGSDRERAREAVRRALLELIESGLSPELLADTTELELANVCGLRPSEVRERRNAEMLRQVAELKRTGKARHAAAIVARRYVKAPLEVERLEQHIRRLRRKKASTVRNRPQNQE